MDETIGSGYHRIPAEEKPRFSAQHLVLITTVASILKKRMVFRQTNLLQFSDQNMERRLFRLNYKQLMTVNEPVPPVLPTFLLKTETYSICETLC
jgi:hypothetical protein